jgi:sodium pump decarboxylase gamma subunit
VSALIESGLTITVIGMGVVFILLTLLVWIIQAMSRFAAAIGGDLSPAPAAAPAGDGETIAVISAAIDAYRRRRH